MKDAGQAVARLLRAQPGGDESGAEHVTDTERAPLEELRAGSLKQKTETSMGFFWDSKATC